MIYSDSTRQPYLIFDTGFTRRIHHTGASKLSAILGEAFYPILNSASPAPHNPAGPKPICAETPSESLRDPSKTRPAFAEYPLPESREMSVRPRQHHPQNTLRIQKLPPFPVKQSERLIQRPFGIAESRHIQQPIRLEKPLRFFFRAQMHKRQPAPRRPRSPVAFSKWYRPLLGKTCTQNAAKTPETKAAPQVPPGSAHPATYTSQATPRRFG